MSTIKHYLDLVKFEHTVFAMPFALLGFSLGLASSKTDFNWTILILVVGCMIFARNAAMAFNRYLDSDIDALNERTAIRHLPAGILQSNAVLFFTIINCVLFCVCTYYINSLCFYLSPIALFVVLFYSYTKRFTELCHLVLGVGLALAPIGAYLAVTASFSIIPVVLGVGVLFWVAGFDIIYALQDITFDKENSLHSIPSYLGERKATLLSRTFHIVCSLLLCYFSFLIFNEFESVGYLSTIAWVIFSIFLIYQHRTLSKYGLAKINLAFFTANGIASVVFCGLILLDLFV